jgi:two-component system phosphate regulon sensor histidine kinase PhoR
MVSSRKSLAILVGGAIILALLLGELAVSFVGAWPTGLTPWGVRGLVWLGAVATTGLAVTIVLQAARRQRRSIERVANIAQQIAAGQPVSLPWDWRQGGTEPPLGDALERVYLQQHEHHQQWLERTQQLEAVLSSMIEGVLAIDAEGCVILANAAACDMLAVGRTQLVGRDLLEVVRIAELQEALQGLGPSQPSVEVEFETLGARRRTLRSRAVVFGTDSPLGVAIVLHDVTELRQLETMRRDFVANVSHELKTPLAAIKAYAETLRMGAINDPDANQRFVEQIERQAELLHEQIADLLQLARVETGTALAEPIDLPVEKACEECVARFAAAAQQAQLSLSFEPPAQSVLARADWDSVRTILNNLVSNAIRYTRPGGSVRIRCYADDGRAVLEVIDTGIGIAPQHHQRVFERFYRVDRARSRDLGGSGLGLSIVKHTVQALGGTIELDSRVGKGSRFCVRIPARSGGSLAG